MSSKTPKKQQEETESARKPLKRSPAHLFFGAVMLIIGGLLLWNGLSSVADGKQILVAPDGRIDVEVADDRNERYQGLSGRESLEGGMLFVYENESDMHCLVMRDMLISLDMVWLDKDKTVINVESNVTPDTYPDQSFCPEGSSLYALELPSGDAKKLGIAPGVRLVY